MFIANVLLQLLFVYSLIDCQIVNVTIFTESQCKYCTSLLHEQIWPFSLNRPGIMNLQVKFLNVEFS